MTVFTFDELAVHAFASGSVDAWNILIDKAIELGRENDVRMLWIMERKMDYANRPDFRKSLDSLGAESTWLIGSMAWCDYIEGRAKATIAAATAEANQAKPRKQ